LFTPVKSERFAVISQQNSFEKQTEAHYRSG